jgi:hypothetical protein
MVDFSMARFSRRLRIIVSIAFALAMVPIAARWAILFANDSAIPKDLQEPIAVLASVADKPWSLSLFMLLGGFAAGVWADWGMRVLDDRRRRACRGLGAQLTALGEELARLQFGTAKLSDWPKNVGGARRAVDTALTRLGQYGIWNPGPAAFRVPRGGEFLVDFFKEIGTLLQSERFDEAKSRARAAQLRFELIGRS